MTVTTAKWTLEDYHCMIEVGLLKGRHVELLNGEIIEMPPEGPEHAQQSTDTADYLRQLLGDQALVRDAKPVTLPNRRSEPEPDLAIVQPLRALYRTRQPSEGDYSLEETLTTGEISPLAFPDMTISVQLLFQGF